jgi:cyclase
LITLRSRYIPVLLVKNRQLYKTVQFNKDIKYIGDPINAIRIFNEKEVDEICVLDIEASKVGAEPNFDFVRDIASECFMPLGYGGGISNMHHIERLFRLGIEKVILNHSILTNTDLISEASKHFGSQSIVASVDVKRNLFGQYLVYSHAKKDSLKLKLEEYIKKIEDAGAGELILNAVDRDGMMQGFDLNLIAKISKLINIPLVALGGAGSIQDLETAIQSGAHASAAGSLFIYKGPHKAVLINYPTEKEK